MFKFFILFVCICEIDCKNVEITLNENLITHPTWIESPWQLHPYLEEQYYKSIEMLEEHWNSIQTLKRTKRQTSREQIRINQEILNRDHLSKIISSIVSTLNVNGEWQILFEDNIFRVHEHENGKIFIEPAYMLKIVDNIKQVETIEYENETIVLMLHHKYSQVFSIPHTAMGNWNRSKLKQTFSSESNKPKRARFILHNDLLYLVVLYGNKQIEKGRSIIYLWTGTHFDELYDMETENPTDLAVVPKKDYYLLIVAQNPHNQNIKSQLYKFIPGYGVFKIHPIPTRGYGKLLSYENFDSGEIYVLVINRRSKTDVFKLVDDELLQLHKQYDFSNVTYATAAVVEGKSIIFIASDGKIQFFVPDHDNLNLIHTLDFHLKVTNIDYFRSGEYNYLLLILKDAKNIYSQIIRFETSVDLLFSDSEPDNPFQCLDEIESLLDERQHTVDEIALKIDKIMTGNGALVDGVLKVNQDVKLVNSVVNTIKITSEEELMVDTKTLYDTAISVNGAVNKLEERVSYVIPKEGPIEIKGTLEIKGDLAVENLSAGKLNVGTVNGKPFVADAFLFNNETQHLPSELFEGKTINVKNLTSSVFNSFLGAASVFQSLTAENIYLANRKAINDVELDNIVLKGHRGTIMGTKTFDKLEAHEVNIERLGKELLTPWIHKSLNNEIPVKNLEVEKNLSVSSIFTRKINGIDMGEFMDSFYQIGSNSEIKGDLRFLSNLQVDNLQTKFVNEDEVDDFMTKTTKQTIKSNIKFKRLLAKNIRAHNVNGLNITRDMAINGRHNTIKGPTKVFDLDVARDLRLNCGSENHSLCNIIPTKPEDLLQMYYGPVTIVGTLKVPELRFTKHAQMRIDGVPFHTEIESLFWMADKSQVIRSDVTFAKGISVPQISVEVVNDHPVERIYSTVNDRRNVSLLLKHVHVNNDVIVPENTHCSLIKEIDRTAVKKTGTYRIRGRKLFSGAVSVDNLNTEYMNNLNMNEIVLKNNENTQFYGDMTFKTLEIKGDLITNGIFNSYSINGFNLENVYERAAKIDQPTILDNVKFSNKIFVKDLQVYNGYISHISSIVQNTFRDIHVYVEGDAHVRDLYGVQQVNDINFNDYMEKVVLKNQDREILGSKYFKGDVVVEEDFYSPIVNNAPFERLFTHAMTIQGDQAILGKHTIDNMIAKNIYVDMINDFKTDQLIDITEDVVIEGDVYFEELYVMGDVNGKIVSPCDLAIAVAAFGTLPAKQWGTIVVEGNVKWDYEDGPISRILEKAVLQNRDTVVDSEVVFEGPVSIKSLWSSEYINDVDIGYIARNSLKKYSETPQIITGRKFIYNDFFVKDIEISDILYSKNINNIDVLELNNSMVRKTGDYQIEGLKVIEADVDIDYLFVPGKIHDVFADELVYDGDVREVKEASFETMQVGNLYVEYMNEVDLNEFLENTIKLNGPEQHIYEDVVFEYMNIDECQLDSINGMPFSNIVVDSEGESIDVHGDNVFMQDVDVWGSAFIDVINDYDVQKSFEETIFPDDDIVFQGNVTFNAPVTVDGNIVVTDLINGVNLKKTMDLEMTRIEDDRIENEALFQHVQYNVDEFKREIDKLSVEFLYADEINYINLPIGEFKKTDVKSFKDQSIVDFNIFNGGDLCGLPYNCLCPKHYKMSIFEDGTSRILQETRNSMRVFQIISPRNILIELVTTTISVSYNCRSRRMSDEDRTWISWKSLDQSGARTSTDIGQYVTGYVSDVGSFYSGGQYYMVVGQFYDSALDTYNLDTVVLRMDIDQRRATLIQRIPSQATWVLNILQFDSNTYLTIGHSSDFQKQYDSLVFRFDPVKIQFEYLQSILTVGCKSIVSATAKRSNHFLVITQSNYEPLMVWKYDKSLEVFVLYQTLYYKSDVKSVEMAFVSNRNMREPLLCVTTLDEKLHIYQHTYSKKWKSHTSAYLPGIQGVIYFSVALEQYLIAFSQQATKVLWLACQGVF